MNLGLFNDLLHVVPILRQCLSVSYHVSLRWLTTQFIHLVFGRLCLIFQSGHFVKHFGGELLIYTSVLRVSAILVLLVLFALQLDHYKFHCYPFLYTFLFYRMDGANYSAECPSFESIQIFNIFVISGHISEARTDRINIHLRETWYAT